jgi:hypothetical protein
MVDKWCAAEWEETHNAYRERRLMMLGAPHHQGNLILDGYAARWVVNSFIYSNAQFCIISNHLAVFLTVASHGG